MSEHVLIAFANPQEGKEREFNEWYEGRHMHDVLAIPGVRSARRYRVNDTASARKALYVAIYHIDAPDPAPVIQELRRRAGTSVMPLSDAASLEGLELIVATATTNLMET